MANRIAEEVTNRLSTFITPSFIYTEQTELPYCVYEVAQDTPLYAKDGIYGYRADVTVYLAADTEEKATQLKDKAVEALNTRREGYVINITSVQPAYGEDQWLQKIDCTVTQLL